ncbi:unnamed protein product [Taenia asiatica]|uniref:Uncharacterized protein n=1 Tax=Taenia asiatica TaxID=60517 RepID=A0A0R3WCE6_TAEAS|nr:unnamed protein product [Taenia asiatica]
MGLKLVMTSEVLKQTGQIAGMIKIAIRYKLQDNFLGNYFGGVENIATYRLSIYLPTRHHSTNISLLSKWTSKASSRRRERAFE